MQRRHQRPPWAICIATSSWSSGVILWVPKLYVVSNWVWPVAAAMGLVFGSSWVYPIYVPGQVLVHPLFSVPGATVPFFFVPPGVKGKKKIKCFCCSTWSTQASSSAETTPGNMLVHACIALSLASLFPKWLYCCSSGSCVIFSACALTLWNVRLPRCHTFHKRNNKSKWGDITSSSTSRALATCCKRLSVVDESLWIIVLQYRSSITTIAYNSARCMSCRPGNRPTAKVFKLEGIVPSWIYLLTFWQRSSSVAAQSKTMAKAAYLYSGSVGWKQDPSV